jgi:hypothetical protein
MEEIDTGLLGRLTKPTGTVDVVLDTDTFSSIDGRYAAAFIVKSVERFTVKAVHAAPFRNEKVEDSADGMDKSYGEILHILTMLKREDLNDATVRGAARFLAAETEPEASPAARNLAELALAYSPERPLYVIADGAITNVASSLLLRPEIAERIVVVWLGGHGYHWGDNREFNLSQDVAAARVLFDSGAAVVQLPRKDVTSALTVSGPELEHHLRGKNDLCDYLVDSTLSEAASAGCATWTRALSDVCAAGWFLDGAMSDRLEPSPIPQYDHHYSFDRNRHPIRYVYSINRDELVDALFKKLAE